MSGNISGSLRGIIACVLLTCVVNAAAQVREWGVNREIVQVSESVYRWGSDNQYGAYIVGTDGIAVIDGHYCRSGTMQWLKEQLAARHAVPVKYVILSHDHPDHVCNSQVFDDTASPSATRTYCRTFCARVGHRRCRRLRLKNQWM